MFTFVQNKNMRREKTCITLSYSCTYRCARNRSWSKYFRQVAEASLYVFFCMCMVCSVGTRLKHPKASCLMDVRMFFVVTSRLFLGFVLKLPMSLLIGWNQKLSKVTRICQKLCKKCNDHMTPRVFQCSPAAQQEVASAIPSSATSRGEAALSRHNLLAQLQSFFQQVLLIGIDLPRRLRRASREG